MVKCPRCGTIFNTAMWKRGTVPWYTCPNCKLKSPKDLFHYEYRLHKEEEYRKKLEEKRRLAEERKRREEEEIRQARERRRQEELKAEEERRKKTLLRWIKD
jgi:predicted  nucleic acid-binding Zn-ribbon protein